jgi:hypothetical protein
MSVIRTEKIYLRGPLVFSHQPCLRLSDPTRIAPFGGPIAVEEDQKRKICCSDLSASRAANERREMIEEGASKIFIKALMSLPVKNERSQNRSSRS